MQKAGRYNKKKRESVNAEAREKPEGLFWFDLKGKAIMKSQRILTTPGKLGFLITRPAFFAFPVRQTVAAPTCNILLKNKAADRQLTRSLFDVTQNAEQGRLHPVAVQCVLPAMEDKEEQ